MPAHSGSRGTAPQISVEQAPQGESAIPFWGLMVFTFVLFVGPQFIFPVLQPLRLALVSGGLAIAVYVWIRLAAGRPLSVNTPEVRLVLWLVALAVLSIPLSYWPGGSFDVLVNQFSRTLAIFFLLANTVDTVPRMKLMMGSMVLWALVLAGTAVRSAGPRVTVTYDSPLAMNPNDLALTLNVVLALAIGLCWGRRSLPPRLFLLAGMGLLAAGVIATFSRGGFLTLTTILLAFLIKWIREGGRGALVLLFALPLLAPFVLPQGYGDRLYSMLDFSYDPSGSAQARWEGMRLAVGFMLSNPLLGVGFGMDTLAFVARGAGWVETHNAFLQVGADLGLPGFVVYVLLVWRTVSGVRRSRGQVKEVAHARELAALGHGIEIALVGYTVAACFHPIAYQLYFYYIAGIAVAFQQITKRVLAESRSGG